MKILPFQKEHVKEALTLYNYYIKNSTATFSIEPISEQEFSSLAFTGLERFPSYVIMDEHQVVGYGLLNRYKPREAYDKTAEVTIYIRKDCHGKGYGKAMLNHLENVAKGYGFRALLAVICAENAASIYLFQKAHYFECAHFKEVGEKFGKVLDVVIYEKLLTTSRET